MANSRRPLAAFTMWVVYDHPSDHPNHFVARKWRIRRDGAFATKEHLTHERYTGLIAELSRYGVRDSIPRQPTDDPVIVESWI